MVWHLSQALMRRAQTDSLGRLLTKFSILKTRKGWSALPLTQPQRPVSTQSSDDSRFSGGSETGLNPHV